jgi:hypothetical protein
LAEAANRWENVRQNKDEADTSRFENRLRVSLDLIAAPPQQAAPDESSARRAIAQPAPNGINEERALVTAG